MANLLRLLLAFYLIQGVGTAVASGFEPRKPACIAPAKPGGGFDITCRVASVGFREAGLLKRPMAVTFMPGGVGAVAFNHINAIRPADSDTLVAFSTGSLLNLAQGKWGKRYNEDDARWVGAAGVDYGAVLVGADAPWSTLAELLKDLAANPGKVPIGAGGGVGSQDWMKAAILVKAAGIHPRHMRYVAYEGGGEAIAALMGGHIKAYPGDIGEMQGQLESGRVRVLAVMSPKRLDGRFAKIPTAIEQGYDVEWTILRGYYLGPDVSDEVYRFWTDIFRRAYQSPAFMRVVREKGLRPHPLAGKPFDLEVKKSVVKMRKMAHEFGLMR